MGGTGFERHAGIMSNHVTEALPGAGSFAVPRVVQQAGDIQTVLAGVAAGVGVAFLPSHAQSLVRHARILTLRDDAARWTVRLAWQPTRDDPVIDRFVDLVREELSGPRRPSGIRQSRRRVEP
jgi:DNA-binding transcriptional LysR family regulator